MKGIKKGVVTRARVGKKGEIYTTKDVREISGLKAPSKVILIAKKGEIRVKTVPSIEELLREKPVLKISFEEAEEIIEKMQREFMIDRKED